MIFTYHALLSFSKSILLPHIEFGIKILIGVLVLTSSGYLIEKSSRVLHGYTVPDCMYDGKAAAAFYPRVHGKVEKGIESSIAAS